MAKEPRTKKSGKEARYILKQNSVNLAWLSEKLGILPQTLQSRLNAAEFKTSYMLEINQILGKDIFDLGGMPSEVGKAGQQPVLDIRVSAGMGIGLDGEENKVNEYVSIPSMTGCVGITVYGDSMTPKYPAGSYILIRPIEAWREYIELGRSYVLELADWRRLIKIVRKGHDATHYTLDSYNVDYESNEIAKSFINNMWLVVASVTREEL